MPVSPAPSKGKRKGFLRRLSTKKDIPSQVQCIKGKFFYKRTFILYMCVNEISRKLNQANRRHPLCIRSIPLERTHRLIVEFFSMEMMSSLFRLYIRDFKMDMLIHTRINTKKIICVEGAPMQMA